MFSFLNLGVQDLLDIFMVAGVIYFLLRNIQRDTTVLNVVVLLTLLLVVREWVTLLGMRMMMSLMNTLLDVGVLAILIIFQPELRSMLERVGGDSLGRLGNLGSKRNVQQIKHFKDELCDAVNEMSMSRTGALIVIEQHTGLQDVLIESKIMAECFRKHKKMEKNINRLCWRIPQKKAKQIQKELG